MTSAVVQAREEEEAQTHRHGHRGERERAGGGWRAGGGKGDSRTGGMWWVIARDWSLKTFKFRQESLGCLERLGSSFLGRGRRRFRMMQNWTIGQAIGRSLDESPNNCPRDDLLQISADLRREERNLVLSASRMKNGTLSLALKYALHKWVQVPVLWGHVPFSEVLWRVQVCGNIWN